MRIQLLVAAVFLFLLGYPTGSKAQPQLAEAVESTRLIEVADADSQEVRRLTLKEGQNADVVVYLSSLGDMLDKFLVILRRESDNKRIQTELSDVHGRVRFRNIEAGAYRVYVSRQVKEDGDLSTVKIGDVRVFPGAISVFPKSN